MCCWGGNCSFSLSVLHFKDKEALCHRIFILCFRNAKFSNPVAYSSQPLLTELSHSFSSSKLNKEKKKKGGLMNDTALKSERTCRRRKEMQLQFSPFLFRILYRSSSYGSRSPIHMSNAAVVLG
ncbi:hypothetical protein XELAEV_18018385mg [Xenopus laevis]|uniref:Uncharacterized protein n=1 Tax=Xenopus laevis TaxID=8355 RepID=A0A974DFM1_XENLA|nr:hypothetical protein XELAEV_18018385mg [Xenopus laevis]